MIGKWKFFVDKWQGKHARKESAAKAARSLFRGKKKSEKADSGRNPKKHTGKKLQNPLPSISPEDRDRQKYHKNQNDQNDLNKQKKQKKQNKQENPNTPDARNDQNNRENENIRNDHSAEVFSEFMISDFHEEKQPALSGESDRSSETTEFVSGGSGSLSHTDETLPEDLRTVLKLGEALSALDRSDVYVARSDYTGLIREAQKDLQDLQVLREKKLLDFYCRQNGMISSAPIEEILCLCANEPAPEDAGSMTFPLEQESKTALKEGSNTVPDSGLDSGCEKDQSENVPDSGCEKERNESASDSRIEKERSKRVSDSGLKKERSESVSDLGLEKERSESVSDSGLKKERSESVSDSGYESKHTERHLTRLQKMFDTHNARYLSHALEKEKNYLDHVLDAVDPQIRLDEAQRRMVLTDEDNCLVIAGAGAGKTTSVAAKVKYLVDRKNIRPEEILVISFTNKAVDELRTRIQKDLGIPCPIATFHSAGNAVLHMQDPERINIVDADKKFYVIRDYFRGNILRDERLVHSLILFFASYFDAPLNENDLEAFFRGIAQMRYTSMKSELGEYCAEIMDTQLKRRITIRNEILRSAQEVEIANFLYRNGIDYVYEPVYRYHIEMAKKPYTPDFLIRQGDREIYLEHFGITQDGRNSRYDLQRLQAYKDAVNEKVLLHRQHGTELIYTFSGYRDGRSLTEHLEGELRAHGIEFHPRSEEEILKKILQNAENRYVRKLIMLICRFITNFKTDGYTEMQFAIMKESTNNVRTKLFLDICQACYLEYQRTLRELHAVDFEDMINDSARALRECAQLQERLPFKYIIVDEYQDISRQRFDLTKALREVCDAKVIAVGDDWQSIYAFSGSDITLFTQFEKKMGPAAMLRIENTYRNAQELIDIAGSFVQKNPTQITKTLHSAKRIEDPVIIYSYDASRKDFGKYSGTGASYNLGRAIEAALDHIVEKRGLAKGDKQKQKNHSKRELVDDTSKKGTGTENRANTHQEQVGTEMQANREARTNQGVHTNREIHANREIYINREIYTNREIHTNQELHTNQVQSKGYVQPVRILLLGRYNFDGYKLEQTDLFIYRGKGAGRQIISKKYPFLKITFMTAHASKGLGYDEVIVINGQGGTYGFPSQIEDDPVLSLVLREDRSYAYAEERRLFYVAMTRTKNRVYFIAPQQEPSEFLQELLRDYKNVRLDPYADPRNKTMKEAEEAGGAGGITTSTGAVENAVGAAEIKTVTGVAKNTAGEAEKTTSVETTATGMAEIPTGSSDKIDKKKLAADAAEDAEKEKFLQQTGTGLSAGKKVCPICGYPLQLRYKVAYGLRLYLCTNDTEICGFMTNNLRGGRLSIIKCDRCTDGYLIVHTRRNGGEPFLGCTNYTRDHKGCGRTMGWPEYQQKMRYEAGYRSGGSLDPAP